MAVFKVTYAASVVADNEEDAQDLFERFIEAEGVEQFTENLGFTEITDPKDPYFMYPISEDDL